MTTMTRTGEQGVALVISLFLMAAMSALAVSLMFLAQTETSASRNYKTMSQARYAGEAGVHRTLNFLSSTAYAAPTSTAGFNTNVSPVTRTSNGQAVVLSSVAANSNYPDSTVVTDFAAATLGTLSLGTGPAAGSVGYTATARLLQMRQVTVYGGAPGILQTWEITAEGTAGPTAKPASVEVKAILERDLIDAQTFAVFATGTGCGAITMQGNAGTGSYASPSPTTTDSGGNLGTNGNLSIAGSVNVFGSLSSPRTGVGGCTNGNVTALSVGGSVAPPSAGTIQLPQPIVWPAPPAPATNALVSFTNMSGAAICTAVVTFTPGAGCSTTVAGYAGIPVINPNGRTVVLGNVSGNLRLLPGNYTINSMGSGDLSIDSAASGNVVINLSGKTSAGGDLATVMDMGGNAIANPSMVASKLQLMYGGTGILNMRGGAEAAMMVYAPNARVVTHGNYDFYGSILTNTLYTGGNTRFFYDRTLQNSMFTFGNYVMSSFSWRKY
jgi:Tfp pilus assembly protein PilX